MVKTGEKGDVHARTSSFPQCIRLRTFLKDWLSCFPTPVCCCLQVPKEQDFRWMPQIVSSAIVNAPPPDGVIKTLHLSSNAHKGINDKTKVGLLCCITPPSRAVSALTSPQLRQA